MTSSLDVRQKQRAVIEFLVSEGEPPKQIFERLVNVYGDASLAYSTVKKWVSRIKHEEDDPSLSSLQDRPRSGRPSSAVNPGNNDKVEKLIRDDRRITIDDIAERVGVSHGSAVNIVNELGFAKVCARWVPRQLLDTSKPVKHSVTEVKTLYYRTSVEKIIHGMASPHVPKSQEIQKSTFSWKNYGDCVLGH